MENVFENNEKQARESMILYVCVHVHVYADPDQV